MRSDAAPQPPLPRSRGAHRSWIARLEGIADHDASRAARRGSAIAATSSPRSRKATIAEPRAHWLARLDAAGVPAGPINTYPEMLADPHTLARGMVVDLVHPVAGPVKALGVPVKLSDTPGGVDRPAPLVGEHTAAILTELGYTDAEQQELKARRVI